MIKKTITLLKSHFFTGLLVLIPFGVIGWIVATTLQLVWGITDFFPNEWQPERYLESEILRTVLKAAFTFAALFLLALGISLLGFTSKHYLGIKLLELISEFIQKIPVLRSIYGALDQLLKTLASGGGQQFSRVVYVEYPRKGVWTLAFVTGPHQPLAKNLLQGKSYVNLYVPTTPNPTSGFYLIASEDEICESTMRVEDAFKTILSLGIAQPSVATFAAKAPSKVDRT